MNFRKIHLCKSRGLDGLSWLIAMSRYGETPTGNGTVEPTFSLTILKALNMVRIVLYISVAFLQYGLYLDYLNGPVNEPYDVLLFIIPSILALIDITMAFWSIKESRNYRNVLPFISIFAIAISLNSMIPFFSGDPSYNILMFYLAVLVVLVSLVELIEVAKRESKIAGRIKPGTKFETRTYDT